MTISDFYALADATGIPCAYRFFPEGSGQGLPFIVFYEDETKTFGADGIVYATQHKMILEFYSALKDTTNEATIETMFDTAGIYWDAYDLWNSDENCNERIYHFTL